MSRPWWPGCGPPGRGSELAKRSKIARDAQRTPDDLAAIWNWLCTGGIDASRLPSRLTVLDRYTRAAATN